MLRDFKTSLKRADFSKLTVRYEVNKFFKEFSEQSRNLPADSLLPSDQMILANFFTLRAQWNKEILVRKAPASVFITEKEITQTIPMLSAMGKIHSAEENSISLVQLPYLSLVGKFPHLHLFFIYSKEPQALEDFIRTFSLDKFNRLKNKLIIKETLFTFPVFQIESFAILNPSLIHNGLKLPFSEQANFTKISAKKGLRLSQVFHKVDFGVALSGTDESIVEEKSSSQRNLMPHFQSIEIKGPFLFLVQDQTTGTILILGVFNNLDSQ